MRDLRRLVATVVIVSFALAALMGIIALLGGGRYGETEGRVLASTVIVGLESVAVLCYLSLAGHRFAAVGLAGASVSVVAFVTALGLTWSQTLLDGDVAMKTLGVSVTLAASLAQASLLLALVGRRAIGVGLAGTLVAIAVLAVLIVLPIVGDGSEFGDDYWRTLGVVAILDVLGTVVLTATGVFRRRPEQAAEPRLLTTAVESRLLEAARQRGSSPSELVSEALDAFLSPR